MTQPSFCQQRGFMQLYNVPLPRININDSNPYLSGAFTKQQLDMRRKVEILKYGANKSSSQTNKITGRMRYAMAMRSAKNVPTSNVDTQQESECDFIPTLTTSSNVPGPPMYLTYDPSVPLYNFSNFNTRTYPDYIPEQDTHWRFFKSNDISLNSTSPGETLGYLIIYSAIPDQITFYSLIIPIAFSIQGTRNTGILTSNIQLQVETLTLEIYYNGNIVSSYDPEPIDDSELRLTFDVSNNLPGAFSAKQFVGNVVFPSIRLATLPNYTYQLCAKATYSVVYSNSGSNSNNYFGNSLKIGVIAGVSPNTNTASNCRISYVPPNIVNSGMLLSTIKS